MQERIEASNQRLKWLDKEVLSSPVQMAEEAKRLQKMVASNNIFNQMTEGLSDSQKNILAGAIATEKSALKAYVPSLLDKFPESSNAFEIALKEGTRNLALDNFRFVNNVVRDAAKATGFVVKSKLLKETNTVLDMVFTDKQNRKFTAFCRLNKQMNPSLAIDLEGFGCDTNECSQKMDEIVKYLQNHGVPFDYKRIKHNQPMGVLRKIASEKAAKKARENELANYLQGSITTHDVVTVKNK